MLWQVERSLRCKALCLLDLWRQRAAIVISTQLEPVVGRSGVSTSPAYTNWDKSQRQASRPLIRHSKPEQCPFASVIEDQMVSMGPLPHPHRKIKPCTIMAVIEIIIVLMLQMVLHIMYLLKYHAQLRYVLCFAISSTGITERCPEENMPWLPIAAESLVELWYWLCACCHRPVSAQFPFLVCISCPAVRARTVLKCIVGFFF